MYNTPLGDATDRSLVYGLNATNQESIGCRNCVGFITHKEKITNTHTINVHTDESVPQTKVRYVECLCSLDVAPSLNPVF